MKILKSFFAFFAHWSELISMPLGIVLWYFSPQILRMLDPTAATYDSGIYQIIIFTIVQFFIYSGIVWLYMKITFPSVYKYIDSILDNDLNDVDDKKEKLTKWQKSVFVLWLFSILFGAIILLARIL